MITSTLTFASLGLGAAASAVIPRGTETNGYWGFTLTGHGWSTANGGVGQLKDGQNRFGGHLPQGKYMIKDGYVYDNHHRGCILTPPTTQWQCDDGAPPTPGFHIGCDGYFKHLGNHVFYACPVNDHGEWNIYLQPVAGQHKCVPITLTATSLPPACPTPEPSPYPVKLGCNGHDCPYLPPSPPPQPCDSKKHDECTPLPSPPPVPCDQKKTDGCAPPLPSPPVPCDTKKGDGCGHPSSSPSPSPPVPCDPKKGDGCARPSSSPSPLPSPPTCKNGGDCGRPSKQCPMELTGDWEFPHLIVPVSSSKPDHAFGNKLNGYFKPDVCTIFNFDVQADYAGKTCSVIFLLPQKWQLETSTYSYKGEGNLSFLKLDEPATAKTTWNSKSHGQELGKKPIKPGQKIHVWSGPCQAGEKVAFAACADGTLELEYFQDFNPEPIGLYMPVC